MKRNSKTRKIVPIYLLLHVCLLSILHFLFCSNICKTSEIEFRMARRNYIGINALYRTLCFVWNGCSESVKSRIKNKISYRTIFPCLKSTFARNEEIKREILIWISHALTHNIYYITIINSFLINDRNKVWKYCRKKEEFLIIGWDWNW